MGPQRQQAVADGVDGRVPDLARGGAGGNVTPRRSSPAHPGPCRCRLGKQSSPDHVSWCGAAVPSSQSVSGCPGISLLKPLAPSAFAQPMMVHAPRSLRPLAQTPLIERGQDGCRHRDGLAAGHDPLDRVMDLRRWWVAEHDHERLTVELQVGDRPIDPFVGRKQRFKLGGGDGLAPVGPLVGGTCPSPADGPRA